MMIYYALYMHKLKNLIYCLFSKFRCINIHNNKNYREYGMVEEKKHISVENIQNAVQYLSGNFNISSRFLLASSNARVPEVLNIRYKRAYREAGMSDKHNHLTEFGKAVFHHLEAEHARTGKPMPEYLPQVARQHI